MNPQIYIEPELRKYMRQLTDDEHSLLEASIVAEGVRDPLVVWRRNGQRVLLDGHHRYEIAQRYGVAFDLKEVGLPDLAAAKRWVIRNQLGRRNLTPAEVSYYRGQEYLEEKRPVGANQYTERVSQNETPTAEAIASRYGVGRATIHRDAQFAQALDRVADIAGDEVRRAVLSREAKLSKEDVLRLDKQAARAPEAVKQVVGAVLAGEAETVKEALREQSRQQKRKQLTSAELPDGKFALIYADPPWQYDFAEDEDRAIENHYPTMPLAELEVLPVADLAAEDCLLWLWTTSPKLREAMRLIEAWGFEYKTSLVWVKDKIGMGYYARQQHELLLVAKRGNPPAPAPEDRPPSVISAPRTAHSAKPEEVYSILERLYPEVAKVELFARSRRPGWAAWGNQVPS